MLLCILTTRNGIKNFTCLTTVYRVWEISVNASALYHIVLKHAGNIAHVRIFEVVSLNLANSLWLNLRD